MTDVVELQAKTFRLIIKDGDDFDVATALHRRGIRHTTALRRTTRPHRDACLWTCNVRVARNVLSAWFAETDGQRAPFPAGTLLHFTEV